MGLHIGVIMDGNRRYAKQLMKQIDFGHKSGLQKAREMIIWVNDINSKKKQISEVTAFCLSVENLNSRPKKELDFILDQLDKECDEILRNPSHPVNKYSFKVNFIGRKNLLPQQIQEKMIDVEKQTKENKTRLNLAVAYGGKQEIVDTMIKITKKINDGLISIEDIDENLVQENLYTDYKSMPDFIIRTGGEHRISNFMLFECAYSELFFTDKKWPELEEQDFSRFIEEFENRKRRFGR